MNKEEEYSLNDVVIYKKNGVLYKGEILELFTNDYIIVGDYDYNEIIISITDIVAKAIVEEEDKSE